MSIAKAPLGSLTVICGSMFSGKTEELIRLVRRAMHARKRVQVFKSSTDTRCDTTVIRTHDGMTFTALCRTGCADFGKSAGTGRTNRRHRGSTVFR